MINAWRLKLVRWLGRMLLTVLCTTMADAACVADTADSKLLADCLFADSLLAQAPHPSGVVVLLRGGDGKLAVALAERPPRPMVYVAE